MKIFQLHTTKKNTDFTIYCLNTHRAHEKYTKEMKNERKKNNESRKKNAKRKSRNILHTLRLMLHETMQFYSKAKVQIRVKYISRSQTNKCKLHVFLSCMFPICFLACNESFTFTENLRFYVHFTYIHTHTHKYTHNGTGIFDCGFCSSTHEHNLSLVSFAFSLCANFICAPSKTNNNKKKKKYNICIQHMRQNSVS